MDYYELENRFEDQKTRTWICTGIIVFTMMMCTNRLLKRA